MNATRVPITAIVHEQPRTTLLDALRDELQLTGTKKGSDRGGCGVCTVLVEDQRVLSCMSLAVMQEGKLYPLQSAFIEHDAFQCGFCTSGQIMSGIGMLVNIRKDWASAATAADVARANRQDP